MLEKQKYIEKKIKCWRNRNILKNRNVGEIEIFKKYINVGEIEILKKIKCWRNRNIQKKITSWRKRNIFKKWK